MKILALDLGDKWVGSALSDALQITCKPYKTVECGGLDNFLATVIPQEGVGTVLVGYPKTFSGGSSEQTLKIQKTKEELEAKFGMIGDKKIVWVLWDERLSSKRAAELHRGAKTSDEKQKSHSIAAAFILQSYLDNLAFSTLV